MTAVLETETATDEERIAALEAERERAVKDMAAFRTDLRNLVAREKKEHGWCGTGWEVLRKLDVSLPTRMWRLHIMSGYGWDGEPTPKVRAPDDPGEAALVAYRLLERHGVRHSALSHVEALPKRGEE